MEATIYIAVNTEDLLTKTVDELNNKKLLGKHDWTITNEMKEALKNEEKLREKMLNMIDIKTIEKVEEEMEKVIGRDAVYLIKRSFDIGVDTMSMNISKNTSCQSAAESMPDKPQMDIDDIDTAAVLQWASLVVDLFLLILSCVGTTSNLSTSEIEVIVKSVQSFLKEPEFHKAVLAFLKAWKEAGGSVWQKAKAIFIFLSQSYSLGMFWKIIMLIIGKMPTHAKTKAIGNVAVMIIAAFGTGGVALIARIALAVHKATQLVQKIANINKALE